MHRRRRPKNADCLDGASDESHALCVMHFIHFVIIYLFTIISVCILFNSDYYYRRNSGGCYCIHQGYLQDSVVTATECLDVIIFLYKERKDIVVRSNLLHLCGKASP